MASAEEKQWAGLSFCDFLGVLPLSLGQAWAEGEGGLATSRLARTADRNTG